MCGNVHFDLLRVCIINQATSILESLVISINVYENTRDSNRVKDPQGQPNQDPTRLQDAYIVLEGYLTISQFLWLLSGKLRCKALAKPVLHDAPYSHLF